MQKTADLEITSIKLAKPARKVNMFALLYVSKPYLARGCVDQRD
jgi:hypothetical protein